MPQKAAENGTAGPPGPKSPPLSGKLNGVAPAKAPGQAMYVELSVYGQRLRGLLDSGASRSVLRRDVFDRLCRLVGRIPVLKKAEKLCGVTGHDIHVLGSTEIADDEVGPFSVVIVEGIGHPLILGRDLLQADGAQIDYALNFCV